MERVAILNRRMRGGGGIGPMHSGMYGAGRKCTRHVYLLHSLLHNYKTFLNAQIVHNVHTKRKNRSAYLRPGHRGSSLSRQSQTSLCQVTSSLSKVTQGIPKPAKRCNLATVSWVWATGGTYPEHLIQ